MLGLGWLRDAEKLRLGEAPSSADSSLLLAPDASKESSPHVSPYRGRGGEERPMARLGEI